MGWFQQDTTSSYGSAINFVRVSLFVFEHPSKCTIIARMWQITTAMICWTLIYHTGGLFEIQSKLVFSDEWKTRINSAVNKRILIFSAVQRPFEHKRVVMNSPGVMKWRLILKDRVIGIHFSKNENTVAESCRNMLTLYAFPCLELLQEDFIFSKMLLLQNIQTKLQLIWTTSIHTAGLEGCTSTLAPLLSQSDALPIFSWGHIKWKIYSTPPGSLEKVIIEYWLIHVELDKTIWVMFETIQNFNLILQWK